MNEKDKYSLHVMENIKRAKVDGDYLGQLILENGGLITFTIEKYVGSLDVITSFYSVELDDLLQVGRIAFINAIRKFDCTKGILFTSYVPTAIMRDVRHYLRDSCTHLKLPRPVHSLFINTKYYLSDKHYEDGRINFDEVAEALGESAEEVKKAWLLGTTLELDNTIKNGPEYRDIINYKDVMSDYTVSIEDEVLEDIYLENLLNEVKSQLNCLEKEILKEKLTGKKQSDIARDCNVSQMKVSRVLKKIKTIIEDKIE